MTTTAATIAPASADDVVAAVRAHARVRARGAGSKPALLPYDDRTTLLDMRGVSGILEYDPGEYTFTALAGTPIAEVARALDAHGQGLPFDPPFVDRGATLGGAVASGLSGSGRHRNGGLRDFILGVRFVDGDGRLVKGGGKVVKNAAGFDLPKLMVGSLGRLGVLVELSFKVFPKSEAHGTIVYRSSTIGDAVDLVRRLGRSTWDVAALDVIANGSAEIDVLIRLGGLAAALGDRLTRMRAEIRQGDILFNDEDARLWRTARELAWVPPDAALVKVPLTPGRVADVDKALGGGSPIRRYIAGAQMAWVAWHDDLDALDQQLRALGLSGLVVTSPAPMTRSPLLGVLDGGPFAARVTTAIDPNGKFA